MPDYAVATTFTAKDRVSPAFKRMGRNADNFGRRTSSAFRNASKEGFRFNTIVKGIVAANVIRGGVAQVSRGLTEVIGDFIKFDDVMIGAIARFDDIGPAAADFNSQLGSMKTQARDLAGVTKFTAVEIAQSLNEMAKAGVLSKEAIGGIAPAMNLAKAAQLELIEATGRSIDIAGAFDLRSGSLETRIKNQNRVTNVLTKAILSARVELEDLSETFKFVGPIATEAGIGFEEAASMAVFLAKAGLRGTVAATSMKAIMTRIPLAKFAAEFKANGVEIEDGAGGLRKYSDILTDIGGKLSKVGSRERIQIFNRLFGLRGITGAGKILKGIEGMKAFKTALDDTGDIAKAVGDRVEQSLLSKLLKLGSAALEAGFRVLEAFEHKGKRGIDALTVAVRNFNVKPIIESLTLLTTAMTTFWAVTAPLRQFLPEIIGGFLAYNIALKGLALAEAAVMFFRLIKAMQLAIGTTAALNLIMTANPIGLIAVGIGAAVAAIIFLERKFGIFSKTWEIFKNSIMAVFKGVKAFFGIFTGGASIDVAGGMEKAFAEARARDEAREAPNAKDAAANRSTFSGQLDITGAPVGSTFKGSHAPSFDVNLLGAAP